MKEASHERSHTPKIVKLLETKHRGYEGLGGKKLGQSCLTDAELLSGMMNNCGMGEKKQWLNNTTIEWHAYKFGVMHILAHSKTREKKIQPNYWQCYVA